MNRLLFTLLLLFLSLLLLVSCRNDLAEEAYLPSESQGWVILDGEGKATPTRISAIPLTTSEPDSTSQLIPIPPTVTVANLPMPATLVTNNHTNNIDSPKQTRPPNENSPTECKRPPCDDSNGSPTPTNLPDTTPIPTATLVISEETAPRFSQTPIIPFDSEVFITHLELVRDSFRSFTVDWVPILADERERNRGDCGAFRGWYLLWVQQAPAFTELPAQWLPLYYEYRQLLQQAFNHTDQIQKQCFSLTLPAGAVQDDDPATFFPAAYPRLEEMLQQAYSIGG